MFNKISFFKISFLIFVFSFFININITKANTYSNSDGTNYIVTSVMLQSGPSGSLSPSQLALYNTPTYDSPFSLNQPFYNKISTSSVPSNFYEFERGYFLANLDTFGCIGTLSRGNGNNVCIIRYI